MLRNACLACAALAAALLTTEGSALAEEKAPQADAVARPETHWYGYQTLVADGVTAGLFAGGALVGDDTARKAFNGVAILGYLFAAPTVHTVHKRYTYAAIDVGVRIGAPLVLGIAGGLVGKALGESPTAGQNPGSWSAGNIGVLGGAVLAGALDALVLASEQVPVTTAPAKKGAAATFFPTVSPEKGGASVGLGGAF